MNEIILNFDKRYATTIPDEETCAGIYVIYSYKKENGVPEWSLLYIGQSGDIAHDFKNNLGRQQWESFAERERGQLIIYVAKLEDAMLREVAERALIFRLQPFMRADSSKSFNFDTTKITVIGRLQKAFGTFVQERIS